MSTQTNPKVSIVIPVYNGANYLEEAIESVLTQTYSHTEIIVINDGSNDDGATEHIAHTYENRIRYFSQPNKGVASALNLGISKMTGEYFSWLSHDDLYIKNKIELQMNILRSLNNKNTILYSDYSIFSTDSNKEVIWTMEGVPASKFRYWITVTNCLHGCTLLIPKSAFVKYGLFNETLLTTQDYEMWFRLARKYQFIHVSVPLVKSRHHAAQNSIKLNKIAKKECNALLSYFIKELSLAEIQQEEGNSVALGYAKIASSTWYRGFSLAGNTAAGLSMRYMFRASLKDFFRVPFILIKGKSMYHIIKPIRKMCSSYLRALIKSILFRKKQEAYVALEKLDLKKKFTTVYKKNMFKGKKSRSGEGSDLTQTVIIRSEIPKLIAALQINTMIDAPCGDWYWMRHLPLARVQQYIGVDIVKGLIKKNKKNYASQQVIFECKDLVTDPLPQADLILSRDCFVHLSFEDIFKILKNFKASKAKYLLTTTFTNRDHNLDLGTGFWRPLNLQLAPFHFPPPLNIINEGCTEGDNLFNDKSLGLWKLEDLSDSILFAASSTFQ